MGKAGQKCQRVDAVGVIPPPVTGGDFVGEYPSFLPLGIQGPTLTVFHTISQSNPLNSMP